MRETLTIYDLESILQLRQMFSVHSNVIIFYSSVEWMGYLLISRGEGEHNNNPTNTSEGKDMSHGPRTFFTTFSKLGRSWCRRSLPERTERDHTKNLEFTVASYNVLADQLMRDNPYLYAQGQKRESSTPIPIYSAFKR